MLAQLLMKTDQPMVMANPKLTDRTRSLEMKATVPSSLFCRQKEKKAAVLKISQPLDLLLNFLTSNPRVNLVI